MSTEVVGKTPSTRKTFIGASDVPAIVGLSPWRTAYDVWAEKTGRVEPKTDTPAMWIGRQLESALLDHAEKLLGKLIRGARFAIQNTPIVAWPDAVVAKSTEPVEAKTTGLLYPATDDWGEEGTDQIPDYYVVQCLIQLEATGAEVCHVPALVGQRGIKMYRVSANKDVQRMLVDACCEFWDKHVLADVPPHDVYPSLDIASRLRRVAGKVTQIADTLAVDEWLAVKDQIKQLEEREKELRQRILGLLGDAEVGQLPDGREITYFEQQRKEYVVPAATFRVLRVKTPKPPTQRRRSS
jgi:putative phage-type endonuclease